MSEKFLTKDDIDELDKRIDSQIENFPFLSHPRDQALFHALLFYILMADTLDIASDSKSKHIVYRNLYHSLNHVVQWIYEHCPKLEQDRKPTVEPKLFSEAEKIFRKANEYSSLWAMMILLHKERMKGKLLEPDLFEMSLANLENRNLDAARMVIGHSDDPLTFEESTVVSGSLWKYINQKLNVQFDEINRELKYKLRGDDFRRLTKEISCRDRLPHMMNPRWDLGGYTFEQLKIFWTALQAICILHKTAAEKKFKIVNTNNPQIEFFSSRIKFQTTNAWIGELTERTRLPEEVVQLIINDLTQNEILYQQKGEKKTHVMYHPFFRFSNNQLAVCERIVISANIERNAWSLTSILRKELFNKLTKEKESFWIREFQNKISSLNLKSFTNIKFKFKNEDGEFDLLLLDDHLKFALVCELKWLTSSDTASGVIFEDKEIEIGRKQTTKAVKWIESNIELLAQKIKYKKEELKKFEFKPIVISRDSIGSGFIGKTESPVINQDLWDWITVAPRKENIKTLWNIADSLSFLPKIGEHYTSDSEIITWGEIRFHLKDAGLRIIKKWKPENDIHLPE